MSLGACGASPARVETEPHDDTIQAPLPEGADRGVFVMRRDTDGVLRTTNASMLDTRMSPCSTFKIPHALVALETGAAPDEHFVIPWDGALHERVEWNQDHDLTTAMRDSVLWYFQALARTIGPAQEAEWLHRLGYGNASSGDASHLTTFWIDGTLTISPREEMDFVSRLAARSLPVSTRSMDVVTSILPAEHFGAATLRAKTGTCQDEHHAHAWWVGWVEDGTDRTSFAALLVADDPSRMDALVETRKPWVRAILHDQGVTPASDPETP